MNLSVCQICFMIFFIFVHQNLVFSIVKNILYFFYLFFFMVTDKSSYPPWDLPTRESHTSGVTESGVSIFDLSYKQPTRVAYYNDCYYFIFIYCYE